MFKDQDPFTISGKEDSKFNTAKKVGTLAAYLLVVAGEKLAGGAQWVLFWMEIGAGKTEEYLHKVSKSLEPQSVKDSSTHTETVDVDDLEQETPEVGDLDLGEDDLDTDAGSIVDESVQGEPTEDESDPSESEELSTPEKTELEETK